MAKVITSERAGNVLGLVGIIALPLLIIFAATRKPTIEREVEEEIKDEARRI